MLLRDKVAVIYGGGGSIGSAVARAFSREGARLFLAGRTQSSLDKTAEDIRAAGGTAATAVLDALDETAVNGFVDSVAFQAGHDKISFNVISLNDVQQPLAEIFPDDFLKPILTAMRSHFSPPAPPPATWSPAARVSSSPSAVAAPRRSPAAAASRSPSTR